MSTSDKLYVIRDCIDTLSEVNEQLVDFARTKKICDQLDRVVKELNDIADDLDDEEAEDNWC